MNNTYKINEAMDFEYVKLPRVLFDKRYAAMSPNAKMLYALLLDRVTLSQLNEWQDESGNVYIIYTRKEAAAQLGMTPNSAVREPLPYSVPLGLTRPSLRSRT